MISTKRIASALGVTALLLVVAGLSLWVWSLTAGARVSAGELPVVAIGGPAGGSKTTLGAQVAPLAEAGTSTTAAARTTVTEPLRMQLPSTRGGPGGTTGPAGASPPGTSVSPPGTSTTFTFGSGGGSMGMGEMPRTGSTGSANTAGGSQPTAPVTTTTMMGHETGATPGWWTTAPTGGMMH